MNPYNQPYPPYQFAQNSSGPPQPPWQAPPRRQGWIDPRQQHLDQATQSSTLSYNPPAFTVNPSGGQDAFGQPYNPTNQLDTATWGVKYNQVATHQSTEQRPPLPPRPASAVSHASTNPPQSFSANTWQQQQQYQLPQQQFGEQTNTHNPAPSRQDSIEWSELYQGYPPSQSQEPLPPPRPPRPLEYQTQIQYSSNQGQMPYEHYSQKPPSHHYEPQHPVDWSTSTNSPDQPTYTATVTGLHNINNPQDPGLVSPIDSEGQSWSYTAPVGPQSTLPPPSFQQGGTNSHSNPYLDEFQASVLGSGNPSDWEHFGTPAASNSRLASPNPTNTFVNQSKAEANASPPISQVSTNETINRFPVSANSSPKLQKRNAERVSNPSVSEDIMASSKIPSRGSANSKRRQSSMRQDSDMSSLSSDGLGQTGTIDSVIQAWSSPLKMSKKQEQAQDIHPSSPISPQLAGRGSPDSAKETYMYEGLGPELRASLRRYVAMLRKESVAKTNNDRFSIVQDFFTAELHFRSKIYDVGMNNNLSDLPSSSSNQTVENGVDLPATKDYKSTNGSRYEQRAHSPGESFTSSTQIQGQSHDDPPQTIETSQPVPIVKHQTAEADASAGLVELADTQKPPGATVSKDAGSENPMPTGPPGEHYAEAVSIDSNADSDNGDVYSPGGRPVLNRDKVPTKPNGASIHMSIPESSNLPMVQNVQQSPSNNAPMVLEDYVMAGQVSPSDNAPMIVEKETESVDPVMAKTNDSKPTVPINFQPSRPVYTPFRYNTTVEAPDRPADLAYSSLRHQAIDSGRLLSQQVSETQHLTVNASRPSTPAKTERDEAFIGLIRTQSRVVKKGVSTTTDILPLRLSSPMAVGAEQTTHISPLALSTTSLKSMLQKPVPNSEADAQHQKISTINQKVQAIQDQFSFIHETFIAWDRSTKGIRRKLDEERNARQTDSEAHIDALFNENEIGYADIGTLEEEFKISEAEKRYEEDREELSSFNRLVYAPVTEKLQSELSELNAQYTVVLDLLDLESEAASRLLRAPHVPMSEVMQLALLISAKIEMRHQKIVEANVERERRRKHLEVTVLYINGDTAAMKKLEREFAAAEKLQVLHEARSKDTRVNKLMDAFDRATVRGLGDNQTFFDELRPKVRELRDIILANEHSLPDHLYGPDGPRQALTLAQGAVDFVLADSRKLLNISNKADQILNEADYNVSVAEARVSDSDGSTYAKLEQEKTKEDGKIVEETNSRLSSIARAPEEITGLIREIVDRVGDDPEHQDRIQKALQAARERNVGIILG